MQPRRAAISTLAVLCWLAGAVNVTGVLQQFGQLPFLASGGSAMLVDNQIDGWLLAAMAIVTLFLAGGLWAAHTWARRAVLPVAALNILITFFTQFEGGQSWLNAVPGILINAAILLYVQTGDAKRALND